MAKALVAPLLVFNLLSAIIILGLAGWYQDKVISADNHHVTPVSPYSTPLTNDLKGFEGNSATSYVITYSLIAGVVSVASYIIGLHHVRVWTSPSAAAAQSAAWIAFLLLILPFSFVWKEIALDTYRGEKLITIESFVIILTFLHFAYTVVLHKPADTTGDASRV